MNNIDKLIKQINERKKQREINAYFEKLNKERIFKRFQETFDRIVKNRDVKNDKKFNYKNYKL